MKIQFFKKDLFIHCRESEQECMHERVGGGAEGETRKQTPR